MLPPQKIDHLKKKLEDERSAVSLEIKELEKVPEMGTDVDHLEEEADETEDFGGNLSMMQALKERLLDINDALDKIAQKKYGVCENCGQEIDEELLEVNPESRLCRNCKTAGRKQ